MKIDVLDHGYVELIEASGTGRDGKPLLGPYSPARGTNDRVTRSRLRSRHHRGRAAVHPGSFQQAGVEDYNPDYDWTTDLEAVYRHAETIYQAALANGVPKELARLVMPVGHYSRMRVKANLRNWLQFLVLRCAPVAQWEIRQYAGVVHNIMLDIFPRTMALWKEGNRL